MDCYSPRKNLNADYSRATGPMPCMSVPNFRPVSPAQPVSGSMMPPAMEQGAATSQMQRFGMQGSCMNPMQNSCTNTAPECLERNYAVAMAYVPWQQWQNVYSMEQGFARGTIFPDLDLPFLPGRCRL